LLCFPQVQMLQHFLFRL